MVEPLKELTWMVVHLREPNRGTQRGGSQAQGLGFRV